MWVVWLVHSKLSNFPFLSIQNIILQGHMNPQYKMDILIK